MDNILQNIHNKHPIAYLWEWAMGFDWLNDNLIHLLTNRVQLISL